MALKILNTTLTPLGVFDLDDAVSGTILGGEHVALKAEVGGTEGYASDVSGSLSGGGNTVSFTTGKHVKGSLGGLADDGQGPGYGTLFGSLIGSTTGQATVVNGAVTIGPATNRGSGKVTVWATPGLFGVTPDACSLTTEAANIPVYGTDATGLLTASSSSNGTQVAVYIARVYDTSLVSTTATAAGVSLGSVDPEYHAVFYLGSSPTALV